MSRTWGLVVVDKITEMPATVLADVVRGVERMWFHSEDGEFLVLGIYPTLICEPLVMERRLAFSLEEAPKLDFPYKNMGTIELLGHKEVHLCLEDVRPQ